MQVVRSRHVAAEGMPDHRLLTMVYLVHHVIPCFDFAIHCIHHAHAHGDIIRAAALPTRAGSLWTAAGCMADTIVWKTCNQPGMDRQEEEEEIHYVRTASKGL